MKYFGSYPKAPRLYLRTLEKQGMQNHGARYRGTPQTKAGTQVKIQFL